MANTLGVYNPIFYANEALIQLEKALGMAARVHRSFEEERRAFQRGETINIRKPSTFTADDAPSTAQNVATETVSMTLSHWREVKFKLTDKELAFTGERIINDHIRPAAYALADDVDQKLVALYADIPWFSDVPGTVDVSALTDPYQTLFDNAVPVWDEMNMHFMIDGTLQNDLSQLEVFHSAEKSITDETQRRGTLGRRFGFEIFANQNTPSHTKGTASTGTLAVVADTDQGATTIGLDAVSVTGTLVPGDTFVIAGNTQRYSITNTTTAATNAFTGVTFTPPLVADASEDDVVTVSLDDHTANMAFHRNAFALVMAPLPDMASNLGARVATVTDPITGLSIRSRVYYVGNSSEVHVALDILFGVKTLDPNLATRARG